MSEKEQIKINLSTFFLILAIIVIIALIGYIYIDKSNSSKEINELKTSVSNMQKTINQSQNSIENVENTSGKLIDNISSTINETNQETSNSNQNTNSTETSSLKTGTYSINEEPVDPGEGSGIESVKLSDNNKFSINLVYGGTTYSGSYIIDNDTLTCQSTQVSVEEGGYSSKSSNTIFEFKILNNGKIKFSSVKNSDNDEEFALNVGLTYSVK